MTRAFRKSVLVFVYTEHGTNPVGESLVMWIWFV